MKDNNKLLVSEVELTLLHATLHEAHARLHAFERLSRLGESEALVMLTISTSDDELWGFIEYNGEVRFPDVMFTHDAGRLLEAELLNDADFAIVFEGNSRDYAIDLANEQEEAMEGTLGAFDHYRNT